MKILLFNDFRAKKFNSASKWLGMVGGTLALVFSTFMLYNQQSKRAAITATPAANDDKAVKQRLDNIKYLSERVTEVGHVKEDEKY